MWYLLSGFPATIPRSERFLISISVPHIADAITRSHFKLDAIHQRHGLGLQWQIYIIASISSDELLLAG